MNLTLGSEEAFSARTVTQVLESVKSEILQEKENELAQERARHAQATQELKDAAEAQLKKERADQGEAQAKLRLALQANEATRKRYYWLSERLGAIVSYPTSGLLVLALLAGLVLSGVYAKPLASGKLWISIPATVTVGVVLVWSILNWVLGWSVLDLHRRVQSWQQRRFYDALCRLFLIDYNVESQ
jgi:hypothetical protein